MTAKLTEQYSSKYIDPSNRESFFDTRKELNLLLEKEKRELPIIGNVSEHCKTNLFFGFFHDGTRNNLNASLDKSNFTESNVARLYNAYPGQSVPGIVTNAKSEWKYQKEQFSNYFRVYTPGVGSEFKQVKDNGNGIDATLGAAGAYLGERRIIWTLAQAINNLHRYFLNSVLINDSEILNVCGQINLSSYDLLHIEQGGSIYNGEGAQQKVTPRDAFKIWLKRLHDAIRLHMPDPTTGKPQTADPGIVKEIYVSIFGFSRGAASARVFTNWLMALCRLDAQMLGKPSMTLGGFKVNFDFLGLFDTVASVGLANTLGYFEGHDAWCDPNVSLRVPSDVTCLHLVSGHEVRRSFPLDSISVNNSTPANHTEIVYPGVHSDLGGGYSPMEQGKGLDATGKDMLSRLPLAHMYRAARLAGVPLKLELADQWIKDDFMIAQTTIDTFNKYVQLSEKKTGSLTEIMRDQRKYYIQWRLARRTTALENTASFLRARTVDQNDLKSANDEFEEEVKKFEAWTKDHGIQATKDKTQAPGFDNSSKDSEWEEIATYWNKKLPEGMEQFFDDYVHDSRAWFKLTGTEADDVEGVLQDWVKIKNQYENTPRIDGFDTSPLTDEQLKYAREYEKTKKVPRMKNDGREVMNGAGYLRYRRIYAGGNSMLISRVEFMERKQFPKNTAEKEEQAEYT